MDRSSLLVALVDRLAKAPDRHSRLGPHSHPADQIHPLMENGYDQRALLVFQEIENEVALNAKVAKVGPILKEYPAICLTTTDCRELPR